jgi:hypothetical protein
VFMTCCVDTAYCLRYMYVCAACLYVFFQSDAAVSEGQAAQVGNQCVYDLLRRHCVLASVHERVCGMFVCLFFTAASSWSPRCFFLLS